MLRIFYLYLLLMVVLVNLIGQSVRTNPIGSISSEMDDSVKFETIDHRINDSIEESFRRQLSNSKDQVYIDTLTSEEVAEHRRTGKLPKRTIELIAKVLKEQMNSPNVEQSLKVPSTFIPSLYMEPYLNVHKHT